MGNKLETIEEIIVALNKNKYRKKAYHTYQDIVDEIKSMGIQDQVLAFDDDHFFFTDCMDFKFLNSKINDLNIKEEYEDDIDKIIEQANKTVYFYNMEITNDIQDDIDEDNISRGSDF